ncbi:uncharacterized protein [Chironomus tepperi]|uniref:uncharacterized protein n=1 Tax=Chironomus tepperi TaxID=113505 RepID=UPI00391F3C8A
MKGFQCKIFFTTCFFACLNAQMQNPQYGGGPGGPGGPGMQGQGGYPPQGGQGGYPPQSGQGQGGYPPQGGQGMQGQGGYQGSEQQQHRRGVPRTKPCLTLPPPEGLNFSGIADGRWYMNKVYFDLVTDKPEVSSVCLYADIIPKGTSEELNVALIIQSIYRNISGPINHKAYGEFTAIITLPQNPPVDLSMKTTILENDGDNAIFYTCGGQQGYYIQIAMVASRLKSADVNFLSKADPIMKNLEFERGGTVVTNQNCPD